MIPGATTRKPLVNLALPGRRTALTVCQAMNHRHHGGLAGAGCQLEGGAEQVGVGLLVGVFEALEDAFATLLAGRDLCQPYERFDGLDLAEEGAVAAKGVAAPVLQEPLCFGRHAPIVGDGQLPPGVDPAANLVDRGGDVVFLAAVGQALAAVEVEAFLLGRRRFFPGELGLGNGRDEFGGAAAVDDPVGGLAVGVELPVLGGVVVG